MDNKRIKLKKDNLEIEYQEKIQESYNIDFEDDIIISSVRRTLHEGKTTSSLITFIENPANYSGIAYRRLDLDYPELEIRLYLYKTGHKIYFEYSYPISKNNKVYMMNGHFDPICGDFSILTEDVNSYAEGTDHYALGLTGILDEESKVYIYSGGKESDGNDFEITKQEVILDEEDLETFAVGQVGDNCLSYILKTQNKDYHYFKNLTNDTEYIYEILNLKNQEDTLEEELEEETELEYNYIFKCQNGIFYDEQGNIIPSEENNIYSLYLEPYIDTIRFYEDTYIKTAITLKEFPIIEQELLALDKALPKYLEELLFEDKKSQTVSTLVKKLNKK